MAGCLLFLHVLAVLFPYLVVLPLIGSIQPGLALLAIHRGGRAARILDNVALPTLVALLVVVVVLVVRRLTVRLLPVLAKLSILLGGLSARILAVLTLRKVDVVVVVVRRTE